MRRIALIAALLAFPAAADASHADRASEAVRAAGFQEHAEAAGRAARPTVWMGRRKARLPQRLGTSRLGGPPDLPRGTRWPTCRGRPQTFLGQLRLRDLPPSARPLRRLGGRLWVFTHVEFEYPDDTTYGLDGGKCTRVLHAPAGTPLRRTERPRRTMKLRPARLRYRTRTDIPGASADTGRLAPPLHEIRVPAERWYEWEEMRFTLNAPDAWPHPVWGVEHRLLGYLDLPNGETGRCWRRNQDPRTRWRHLLTIGPDLVTRFEVADGGRIQIAISPVDLRRGRFDRVCGIFDSA